MVEAAKPRPIPDGQLSDSAIQNTLVSSPAVRMNSQEQAAFLAQKFRQQQNFYQAAKLEGALGIVLISEKRPVLRRQIDIMERVLVKGENFGTIAGYYEAGEGWASRGFGTGLIRLWHKCSPKLQKQYPLETIIPGNADARRQRAQEKEDDLVKQLQRKDISTKEEVERMMEGVNPKFYFKHRELFVNLPDFLKAQGVKIERDAFPRIIQMVSELLRRQGIVVKEIALDKSRPEKRVHIIWSGDFDEAGDIFNEYLRPFVESIISL